MGCHREREWESNIERLYREIVERSLKWIGWNGVPESINYQYLHRIWSSSSLEAASLGGSPTWPFVRMIWINELLCGAARRLPESSEVARSQENNKGRKSARRLQTEISISLNRRPNPQLSPPGYCSVFLRLLLITEAKETWRASEQINQLQSSTNQLVISAINWLRNKNEEKRERGQERETLSESFPDICRNGLIECLWAAY